MLSSLIKTRGIHALFKITLGSKWRITMRLGSIEITWFLFFPL